MLMPHTAPTHASCCVRPICRQYNKCAPYRAMSCLYVTEPSDCGRWGSCSLVPRAICLRDNCTVWDATKNVSLTDPCCGFKGDCSQAPLPLMVSLHGLVHAWWLACMHARALSCTADRALTRSCAEPMQEAATCQWDESKQNCWLRRVDNCTASSNDMEAKLMCQMAEVGKANAAKPLPELGANICNGAPACCCMRSIAIQTGSLAL